METSTPSTPSRHQTLIAVNLRISEIVENLNREWRLGLEIIKDELISPRDRPKTDQRFCIDKITALCFKGKEGPPLQEFDARARTLWNGWVYKPGADRGVIPEPSEHHHRGVTTREQKLLLECLRDILTKAANDVLKTPQKRFHLGPKSANTSFVSQPHEIVIDDSPLPLKFSKISPPEKRFREQEGETAFKRPKLPEHKSAPDFSDPALKERGRSISEGSRLSRSANTSFETARSAVSSIFDGDGDNDLELPATQQTIPDGSLRFNTQPHPDFTNANNTQSSDYEFNSSLEQALVTSFRESEGEGEADGKPDMSESSDIESRALTSQEQNLIECLQGVFPETPHSLLSLALHVRYEVVRVFLYTETPLTKFEPPSHKDPPIFTDRNALWSFLHKQPALFGKRFPEQVGEEVWKAAGDEYRSGFQGVTMGGSLRYHESSSTGPLFRFQLKPLELEKTHRLGRRFGNDRFLELDIPHLTGRRVPKVMKDAGHTAKNLIIWWLCQETHHILGRIWSPFSTKEKDRREIKAEDSQQGELDLGTKHRIYFYATAGHGFSEYAGTPKEFEKVASRSKMSVEALLNWLRPTRENEKQSYLKLFSRTALGLSRNTPTVVVPRDQIRYEEDKYVGKENMTDGGGRISWKLACQIRDMMGLSPMPSGFQARIGEAKGFWAVEPDQDDPEEWIEVYSEQRKWKRNGTEDDYDYDDPAHRTFEVVEPSGRLESKGLNLQFLPILMARARSQKDMREALEQLIEDGLTGEINSQRVAMDNPGLLRKWLYDCNPGLSDRVHHNGVPYRAGVPIQLEERLGMFLENGFNVLDLRYLRGLAREVYSNRCQLLKEKLRIPIPRSTNAFMVPDWTCELEADEVYLHISKPFVEKDKDLPKNGFPLQAMDVLVARNPAHYVSDIQRVRAVCKPQLEGRKDIIIFSTKASQGQKSLAGKLSGGDYDGDKAWVCWEPTIVDNFINAEVPEDPQLVKNGHISQISESYVALTKDRVDPTATFLQRSFEFNLGDDMLGICTKTKERLIHKQISVGSEEAAILSALLSSLVDWKKQGYVFTQELWSRFLESVIKVRPRGVVQYMDDPTVFKLTGHIIDDLRFVAHETIEMTKKELFDSMEETQAPPQDNDLLSYYNWASKEPEYKTILEKLEEDIKSVKTLWSRHFAPSTNDLKPTFGRDPFVTECYENFQAILPAYDPTLIRSALARTLLAPWHKHPEHSQWSLLRASTTYALCYSRLYKESNFMWWMAGRELCHIKAKRGETGMVVMARQMHAMMKPNGTYVKLKMNREQSYQWRSGIGEEDEAVDDD